MRNAKNKNYSVGKASTVAGICLLLVIVLTAYANFGVIRHLEAGSDTPYNFSNSIGSVRIAIVCLLVVAVLNIIVALALYRVLAPVHKSLSKLATLFRLLSAGVFIIALTQLLQISIARGGARYIDYVQSSYGGDYITSIQNNVDAFHIIRKAGLILLGLHLLLIGCLAYRATYIPRVVGVLLAAVGLGYFVGSLVALHGPDYSTAITGVAFIGEAVFIFWLLLKGRRLKAVG